MAIRVRYKPTDLSEGVVEIIHEADDYKLAETGEIILLEVWTDDDDGGRVKRSRVGVLRAGAWDSVVLMAEASGDSDG